MTQQISQEKTQHHAEILANRVKKMYSHLRKRFAKQNIDCYRLYDWDIPEVRAVVDYYKGHLVIGEYVRKQTPPQWLPTMAKAVSECLDIPMENVHVKERRTSTSQAPRYRRLNKKDERFIVNERDLKFLVNLNDFLDTGLYSDHRDTREMVKKMSSGKPFLNLFCYTGAFTCAALKGGAKFTVSVDRSATYLEWAKENLQLNDFMGIKNYLVHSDVFQYLERAKKKNEKFPLIVVDPPSFFRLRKSQAAFDISEDHPELLKAVLEVAAPKATIFFSTNHQRFESKMDALNVSSIKEITKQTVPEDYRNKQIHRCWQIIS